VQRGGDQAVVGGDAGVVVPVVVPGERVVVANGAEVAAVDAAALRLVRGRRRRAGRGAGAAATAGGGCRRACRWFVFVAAAAGQGQRGDAEREGGSRLEKPATADTRTSGPFPVASHLVPFPLPRPPWALRPQ